MNDYASDRILILCDSRGTVTWKGSPLQHPRPLCNDALIYDVDSQGGESEGSDSCRPGSPEGPAGVPALLSANSSSSAKALSHWCLLWGDGCGPS